MSQKLGILKCEVCDKYTLKLKCPNCNKKPVSPKPPKFSPEDRWGHYRRLAKKEVN